MLNRVPKLTTYARRLRHCQTDAERKLWKYLRDRQLTNVKFRRQHPIGLYIVDFCCLERKIIIELDGGQHAVQRNKDQQRTSYLNQLGYQILRFWDHEILRNTTEVLEKVIYILNNPHPDPLPERERGIFSSVVVAIILSCLSWPALVSALPANNVTPISPREYFQQVHPLLQNAQKSIRLVIYEIRYYPRFKNSPTNLLIQALIEAHKRGVSVEVIVEESNDHAVDNAQKNREAVALLEKEGILVYFDSPDTTTHDKILVIDERYVVIGSTNWSYHALEKNNESSVLIDSPELAKHYLEYFESLKQ